MMVTHPLLQHQSQPCPFKLITSSLKKKESNMMLPLLFHFPSVTNHVTILNGQNIINHDPRLTPPQQSIPPPPDSTTTANAVIFFVPPPCIDLDVLKAGIQEWYLFETSLLSQSNFAAPVMTMMTMNTIPMIDHENHATISLTPPPLCIDLDAHTLPLHYPPTHCNPDDINSTMAKPMPMTTNNKSHLVPPALTETTAHHLDNPTTQPDTTDDGNDNDFLMMRLMKMATMTPI